MDKEVRWTKKCKDKSLVGTVKEVIHQISHSKKWAFVPKYDEQEQPVLNKAGKPVRIPSYSLLQDRFFEHMRGAGYKGFERGVRGSTDEHLPTIAYKIKQDKGRLERITEQIIEKDTELTEINQELTTVKPIKTTFDEISAIGKKKLLSDRVDMRVDDYDKLQTLAKEGLNSRNTIDALNRQIHDLNRRIWALKDELNKLYERTKDFFAAIKLAPERVKELFADIFQRAREERLEKTRYHNTRAGGK